MLISCNWHKYQQVGFISDVIFIFFIQNTSLLFFMFKTNLSLFNLQSLATSAISPDFLVFVYVKSSNIAICGEGEHRSHWASGRWIWRAGEGEWIHTWRALPAVCHASQTRGETGRDAPVTRGWRRAGGSTVAPGWHSRQVDQKESAISTIRIKVWSMQTRMKPVISYPPPPQLKSGLSFHIDPILIVWHLCNHDNRPLNQYSI